MVGIGFLVGFGSMGNRRVKGVLWAILSFCYLFSFVVWGKSRTFALNYSLRNYRI